MAEVNRLIRLVIQLIISPVKAIKGIEIISYDRDAMLRLFSIVSAVYGIIYYSTLFGSFNAGILLVVGVLFPILMFVVYNITTFLWYITIKLFGKEIKPEYDGLKTILYPFFLTMLSLYTITLLIVQFFPLFAIALRYIINAWFNVMIFLIVKFKLKQTTIRSILISSIPIVINIIFIIAALFINV
jgi:hypothetical protein